MVNANSWNTPDLTVNGATLVGKTGVRPVVSAANGVATGFASWAAAGPYFDDSTLGTFKLLVGGSGYIKSVPVTWVAQDYTGMTAGNCYFIYIDSTGTIGAATAHTNALYEDYIVLFECLRDSTAPTNNQVTVCENHPYSFNVGASNFLHDTAGPVIDNNQNGANITLDGTQGIQINGTDDLLDHGLITVIPDSGGAAVTWNRYYTNAGGKWARQNATTTFTGFWNSAGTATALSANRHAVYRLYVSKQSLNSATPTYFAVLHTAQFNTVGAANTAIANGTIVGATAELALLELAQLGYIVYSEASASIVQVTISKSTLRSTITTAGASSANLVTTNVTNFDGWLSATDTTVQTALETLDEKGKSVTISAAGEVTLPLQPAFLAIASGAQSNVTGDTTSYKVLFATEIFDRNSDFAASTFTAPVAGVYRLEASVSYSGIAADNTTAQLAIVTTARGYVNDGYNPFVCQRSDGYAGISISCLANMAAGETAEVQLAVGPAGTKGIDILVDANAGYTYFSGNLVC